MQRLLPQIDENHGVPNFPELVRVTNCPSACWLVAEDGHEIIGTLTLVVFAIPSQIRAWLENVVVDEAARGRGVGEALCQEALRRAHAQGARAVELTSRSQRVAANKLYRRIGFVHRDTNSFRYTFEGRFPNPAPANTSEENRQ